MTLPFIKHPTLPILLAIATAALFLYGCILGPELKEEPCTDLLTVENPIPDTNITVGDTLLVDLDNPPVFVSTANRRISYQTLVRQREKRVHLNLISNSNENERLAKLTIIGESAGKAMAEVKASSSCDGSSTTFNVTVTDP
jgi:hypothetical protein